VAAGDGREEHIEIVLVIFEQILDVVAYLEEVDEDVALAHTTGAFYHHITESRFGLTNNYTKSRFTGVCFLHEIKGKISFLSYIIQLFSKIYYS